MNTIRKHKKLTGLTTTVAYAALALSSFPGGLTAAPALPTGGHVVSGNAAIHQNGPNGLQIDQSSRAAIINWGDFSIGREGNVHFANGTGATLNRVTGGLPSRIDGSLTATGGVYLVNQAGVVVGKEGRIDTGGSFVASTHDVSDSAFLAGGDLVFSGSSDALVINAGQIGSLGGDVALIARRVENTGKLTAPQGAVALAAGYEVLARDAALSDGKFLVRIGGSDTAALNAGAIEAAAAELRANGGNVYALAGNTAGIIKATAVNQSGGRIIFDAGSTGAVELAGTIDASAQSGTGILPVSVASQSAPAPSGGLITATGQTITVKSGATLDASGATGGKILLGGDYQGGKNAASNFAPDGLTLATATTTTVEAGSLLRADGLAGDGGRIVVWADHLTSYAGHLSAQALGLTGDGGFTEVSGKNLLAYTGTADLRSARGVTGSLLLDPYNITIQASGTTAGSFDGSGNYTPTGSILRASDLEAALATSNVLVTTGGADSPGSQDGNIIVNAPLEWTSGNRLELSAYKNITIARDINAGSGSLILRSDNTGTGTGTVNFSSGTIITASGGVKIYFNPASNPVGSIVNPDSYKMETLVEQSAFWGHLNPDITTPLSAYMLVNTIYDLQNVSNNLNGFGDLSYNNNNRLLYALGRDIDATETITWNSGMGFLPIGSNNYLATTFDGQNHVISNLFSRYGGLFFSATGGYQAKILNLGLVDSYAEGNGALGALLNTSSGSATEPVVIDNVFASNATVVRTGINTSTPVGGLIGTFAGVLSNAWVSGSIASIRTQAGGLVGTLGAGSRVENAYSNVYFVLTAGQGETAGYHPIASSRPAGSVLLNTYWNTDRTAAADATGMTGLTSVQLADQANFAGFDFANTWAAPTTGAPFPTLKSFGSRDYHLDPAIIPVTYVIGGTAAYHYVYGDNPPAYVPPDLTLAFDGVDAADLASGLVRMVIYQQPVVGSQTDLATWYASFTANSQASDYNITALATLTSDSIAGYKKYVVNQKRSAELGTASIKMTVEKAPLIVVLRDIVKDVGETFAEGAVGTRYIEGTDLLSLFIENIEGLKNGQTPNRIQIVVAESGTENLRTVNLSKTGSNYSTSSLRVTTSTGGNANATTNYNMVVVPGSVRFGTAPVEKLVTYRFGLSGVSWVYGTDDRSLISWMLSGADEGDEVLGVLAIQNAGGDDVTAQSLLNAGTYKLTIGSLIGSEAGDYQINHVRSIPGTLTVQPVKLTYAFGQPTYTWSYSHDDRGQITWVLKDTNNQDFTDVAGSLVIKSGSTDVTAQSVIPGGAYALTINIADPNYQLTGTAGALTVSKIPLTITLANFVKSLDELTSFTEGTVGTKYVQGADLLSLFIEKVEGLADVDEITRLRIIVSESGTTNVRTVAPYTSSGNLQSTTLTITHDGGSLTFLNSYNVTILPGSITYTDVPVAKDVTYDFSGNAVTNWVYGTDNRGNITWRLDGVEGSDAVTGVLAIKQGETDVTAQALLNAGTYELHIGSLAGANAGDYRIAATGNTPGSLTVSKAPLTLKANDGLSKVYGDAFTFLGTEYAISAGQLYGTDAITGVTLTSDGAAATAGVNGGAAWAVTASDATGSGLSNYEITYTPGQLTVTPAALTIKADDRTKDFGQTFTFAGTEFTVTGLKNSDEVASATLASDGAATGAAIDSYAITIADATGTGLENYTISYEPGTLTVQAVLTDVTYAFGPGYTWSYGDTPGTITWTLDGLIGADADTVTGVLAVQNSAGATVTLDALLNAGSYTLSIGSLTGDNSENYRLAATGNTLGSLVITPRVLTIATQGTVLGTKVYDGTTALEILTHGLLANVVNGDSVGLALAAAYADKNAGEGKSVTGTYALTNNDAGNYTLTGSTAFTGTAGITAKSITVGTQGTVSSKTYDGTTAATVATHGALAGLIAGDTVNLTLGGVTFASKNAGSQSVSGAYTIDGADAGNYTLAGNAFTGTATITPKQLTIGTAGTVATNKVYDGLLTIEVTGNGELSGVITGDTVSIALGNTQFADKNVGNGKAVTGTYTLGGADVGNYTLASTAFTGTSSITPASLTIGTQGTVAGTKIYDGTTAIEILTDGAVAGLIGSDSVSLALAAAYADRNVGEAKDVLGTYTLGGTDAGNYILTTDAFTGAATITAATLTYIANPASRVEGAANPAFTGSVTGFVGDETLATATTGSLIWSSPANTASGPGSYAINGGGLEAQNYVFVQAEGNATALTITAKTTQPETPADEVLSEFLSNNPVRYETPAGTGAGASLEQLLEQFSGEQKQESSPGSLTTDGEDADGVHPDNRDLGPWLKIASLK